MGAEGVCAGKAALFDIAITSNRIRRYYTSTGRFVRKSYGVDFKVQDDSKLDCVVEPSILIKQGFKDHPGQETARYGVDFVRKIGCSSLLTLIGMLLKRFVTMGTTKPKYGVADVFRQYGREYRQKYGVTWKQLKVMLLIERCRTAVMGGFVEECDTCEKLRVRYCS